MGTAPLPNPTTHRLAMTDPRHPRSRSMRRKGKYLSPSYDGGLYSVPFDTSEAESGAPHPGGAH